MPEILRAASAEMAEAAVWYDERVTGLGERFLSEAGGALCSHRRDTAHGFTMDSPPPAARSPADVPSLLSVLGGLHPRAEGRRRCGRASSPKARILGEAIERHMNANPQREVWEMLDRNHLAQVARKGPEPIFATISGAHLYGFASPDSDVDLRGAFMLTASEMLGLHAPEENVDSIETR